MESKEKPELEERANNDMPNTPSNALSAVTTIMGEIPKYCPIDKDGKIRGNRLYEKEI
jgi:hypothetical protein